MATDTDKVRENRVRRAAARQGLVLQKSRRRDLQAMDYGMFWLVDGPGRRPILVYPRGYQERSGASLEEIEEYLAQ